MAHRRGSRRRWLLEGSWIFGVWLAGALVFYRAQWTSGFKWALLLFSTYYTGWFSTLAIGIALVLLVIVGLGPLIREAIALRKRRTSVICGCAGLAAGLIPFARTYLPAGQPTTYALAMHYAGRGRDLANVGQANLIWSELLKPALKARAPSGPSGPCRSWPFYPGGMSTGRRNQLRSLTLKGRYAVSLGHSPLLQ